MKETKIKNELSGKEQEDILQSLHAIEDLFDILYAIPPSVSQVNRDLELIRAAGCPVYSHVDGKFGRIALAVKNLSKFSISLSGEKAYEVDIRNFDDEKEKSTIIREIQDFVEEEYLKSGAEILTELNVASMEINEAILQRHAEELIEIKQKEIDFLEFFKTTYSQSRVIKAKKQEIKNILKSLIRGMHDEYPAVVKRSKLFKEIYRVQEEDPIILEAEVGPVEVRLINFELLEFSFRGSLFDEFEILENGGSREKVENFLEELLNDLLLENKGNSQIFFELERALTIVIMSLGRFIEK